MDRHTLCSGRMKLDLDVLQFKYFLLCFAIFRVLGSLQTSLLCIMGDLAGGGSVAVAIGVSGR